MQPPCAFSQWRAFLEPQARAPGLFGLVSRTRPDTGGHLEVCPHVGVYRAGGVGGTSLWSHGASTASVVLVFLLCHVPCCPQVWSVCRGPSALPVVLSRVGRGFCRRRLLCSGTGLWDWFAPSGTGPGAGEPAASLFAFEPLSSCSDSFWDFVPLVNSGVVLGENPRFGHTVARLACTLAASRVACPHLSGS